MRDYTCTVAGKSVIVREDWQDRAAVPATLPPPAAAAPHALGRGAPIEPGEDAAELPPGPRWEDLLALYIRKRMLEGGKAARGMEAVAESGRLYSQATANPQLTAMGDECHTRFLAFLKGRTWRGKPLSPKTIRKHFRNLSPVWDYGGELKPNGEDTLPTACRLGLYGFDAAGRPKPPPMMYRRNLPRVGTDKEKPAPTPQEVSRWIDRCAALQWTPRQVQHRLKITRFPKGFWLACLLTFFRNTAMRLESVLLAEWDWLDGHWLTIPAWAYKGRVDEREVYVNSWAMGAALAVKTDDKRIFSWTFTRRYANKLIREIAPEDRKFRVHRLRATLNTELVAAGYPSVGKCQLGHKKGDVTREFYTQYKSLGPDVLERDRMVVQPRPKLIKLPGRVFIRPEEDDSSDDGPQRRLF